MKSLIRSKAQELGFDFCRFTTATSPGSGPHFLQWLSEGKHGAMLYLERNAGKRLDPQAILPGAKSIIVLAASYFISPMSNREKTQSPHGPAGVIARYARHADYHDMVGDRLKGLCAYLERIAAPPVRSLWYVDTGPLLERDLAQRAGLGFVGKHTNLISRDLGNWFFLCEILTTVEFEPDPSEKNRCGCCTRCISSCPTAAITAPFQLDARRCISYLTIEWKGAIPFELRAAIGNRIFGCDDCLAACPWNRFAQEGRIMKENQRLDLATPDLLELLALDDVAFKVRFGGTPILRAKRKGLLRNVCVALGNVGDESALSALHLSMQDPEPLIAEHAAWAVEQITQRAALGLS